MEHKLPNKGFKGKIMYALFKDSRCWFSYWLHWRFPEFFLRKNNDGISPLIEWVCPFPAVPRYLKYRKVKALLPQPTMELQPEERALKDTGYLKDALFLDVFSKRVAIGVVLKSMKCWLWVLPIGGLSKMDGIWWHHIGISIPKPEYWILKPPTQVFLVESGGRLSPSPGRIHSLSCLGDWSFSVWTWQSSVKERKRMDMRTSSKPPWLWV